MNFYIYIYLDPRKPGKYKYGSYEFEYEPFYIGKGKENRYIDNNYRNIYFKNKINKIKELELDPIIIKVKDHLCEKESFVLESKLINLIGRKDLNKGPLINMTDGGGGRIGYTTSEKTKKKISEKLKGVNNPMFGMKGENHPMFGKHHSEETRRKISNKLKGRYKGKRNPMFGKQRSEVLKRIQSEKMKGRSHSKKTKELISIRLKGENHPRSILTEKDVIQIWEFIKENVLNQREIGEKFGVHQAVISAIKNGKSWKHINLMKRGDN